MRNWLSRNRYRVIAGVIPVATAVTALLLYPSKERIETLTQVRSISSYYLARHAQGFITTDQYPAAATTAWHARMSDFSGNLQMEKLTKSGSTWSSDSWHALTKNGTPLYQLRSPIPVKGQGRKGWNFDGADEIAKAEATSINEIGSRTAFSLGMVIRPNASSVYGVAGSSSAPNNSGFAMWQNGLHIVCGLGTGTDRRYCSRTSVLVPGKLISIICRWSKTSNTWNDVTFVVNGVSYAGEGCSGAAQTGDLANDYPFAVGGMPDYSAEFVGQIYEAWVAEEYVSDADGAEAYRQLLKEGSYYSGGNLLSHYKFQETTAKDGLRDSSGNGNHLTTVVGTPDVQYGNPPYPMGNGFARRGIGFDANADQFQATSSTWADQTTNDFTVCGWLTYTANASSAYPRVVDKVDGSNYGYSLYLDEASMSWVMRTSDGAGKDCYSNASGIPQTSTTEHFVCAAVDFGTSVGFFQDGVNLGASGVCNVGTGSISSSWNLTVGNWSSNRAWEGNIHEVVIFNGLMTLAEHQAIYRAFKVPAVGDPGVVSPITYAQTSSGWKWPLPPEDGFGVRSSNVAGSSSNPQWPVAYSEKRISTANPLGLEFPTSETVTNIIGYPNEFNSWSQLSGASTVANITEAPDGSMTADRVTLPASGAKLYQAVVGGGSTAAGERWVASVSYKFVSGTGCQFRLYPAATGTYCDFTGNPTTWTKISCPVATGALLKAINLYLQAGTSCIYDFADAQYTQNQVYPDCTNCTGNSNCVCNPSWQKQDWSAYATYMPTALERGEVTVEWSGSPGVHAADAKQVIWQLGDFATMYAGMQPAFVLRNQGGGVEAVARAKPLQILEEGRTYTASWDLRDGLTNTGPSNWGWDFGANENVAASSTSVLSRTTAQGTFTVEILAKPTVDGSIRGAFGSNVSGGNGWGVFFYDSSGGSVWCHLQDGSDYHYKRSVGSEGYARTDVPQHFGCVFTWTGSAWQTTKVYAAGRNVPTNTGSVGTVTDIENSHTVKVGELQGAGSDLEGQVYEIMVSNGERTEAEMLAHYQRSRYQGLTWQDDSSTLAHYTFSEANTSSGLRDSTANGNHLTVVTGSPTAQYDKLPWPDDQRQYAGLRTEGRERTNWGWNFEDSSSEYVAAAGSSALSIGAETAWTTQATFRRAETDDDGVFGSSWSSSTAGYGTAVSAGGLVYCFISDGTSGRQCGTTMAVSTTASMITCVYTKGGGGTWNDPTIYLNNAVVGSPTCSGTAPTGDIANGVVFSVGKPGSGTQYFNGDIYEIRVLNRSFSGAEVAEHYARTLKGLSWEKDSSTLAHYLMDETSRSQGLRDTSGNNNHLTVINGTPDPHYSTLPYENTEQTFDYYQPAAMAARTVTSTTNPVEAPSQRDLNAYVISVGCDHNGQNCSNGGVADITFTSRPAQKIVGSEVDLAYMADLTGPAWVSRAPAVDLCDFDFGVSSSNRWCWNMAEYSGKIRDQVNGVELTATGTPVHQVNSGLLARGQGRRGVNFSGSSEYASSSAAALKSMSGPFTYSVLVYRDTASLASTNTPLMGTSMVTATAGASVYDNRLSNTLYCRINDGTNTTWCAKDGVWTQAKYSQVDCIFDESGGIFALPKLYYNGVEQTGLSCSNGSVVTGTAGADFRLGSAGATTDNPWKGQVLEAMVSNKARSAAEILANYNRTVQTGRYWEDDSNTLAHFKMNETAITNGIGLKDHSGNGNHLTVVSGTPDPDYRDMPWPAGSGTVKPVVSTVNGAYFRAPNTSVGNPNDGQSFSVAAVFRVSPMEAPIWYASPVRKDRTGTAAPKWALYVNTADGIPYFNWVTTTGTIYSNCTGYANIRDGRWHLLAAKAVYSGGNWTVYCSRDAGNWNSSGTTGGTVSGNDWYLDVAYSTAGTVTPQQVGGIAVWKNYALTDADVAQLWDTIKGPLQADHTYARTSTGPKGVCYDVAIDPINGMVVKCFGNNEVPYAYSSNLIGLPGSERLGLGMPVSATAVNLITYSENLEQNAPWAPTRMSVTANGAFAPDGTKTADTFVEDGTASATHYVVRTSPIATTGNCLFSVYGKRVTRDIYLLDGGTGDGFYCLLSSCTTGNTVGTIVSKTATGVGNGWCRCDLVLNRNTSWLPRISLSDGNSDTFSGLSQDSVYAWGAQLVDGSTTYKLYCPTNASSQTCNAPTSNYVGQSLLAGWSREEGIIAHSGMWPATPRTYFSLNNAVDNKGLIYGSPGYDTSPSVLAIFNSAGTIQQNITYGSGGGGPPTGLAGSIGIFDSQEAFYQTTRRTAARTFSASYAGPLGNWATDTGANWTMSGGTNFYLGYSAPNPIDDICTSFYIYNRR